MIARRFAQARAACLLDVDQSKIFSLKRARLAGFSLDYLVKFLILPGSDDLVVKERLRSRGHARLLVACWYEKR